MSLSSKMVMTTLIYVCHITDETEVKEITFLKKQLFDSMVTLHAFIYLFCVIFYVIFGWTEI
jgi:heme/copper-type cytochrome/quinol oxidase subunit 1